MGSEHGRTILFQKESSQQKRNNSRIPVIIITLTLNFLHESINAVAKDEEAERKTSIRVKKEKVR